MSDKSDRIAELQAELESLMSEAESEVEETLTDAEQEVQEVAETVNDETKDAHESVSEAEHEVEQAVEEVADETAKELGHPELAGEIADHLFQRLESGGYLPHQQHHETHHESEVVQEVETAAPVVPEAEAATAEVTPDTPPEPQHFWYRKRRVFGRHI